MAKLFTVGLFPIGLLLLALAISLGLRRRNRFAIVTVCIFTIWISAMPATARYLSDLADTQYPPQAVEAASSADAIVVLGGGIARPDPMNTVRPGPDAARAWYGSRLLKAGKAPILVISGGGAPPEADLVKILLDAWAIPDEQVILETRSRTTRQNAVEVNRVLVPRGISRILLVTSSPHMHRAAPAFGAMGFEVIPFAIPYLSPAPADERPYAAYLPTAEGLYDVSTLLLEHMGRLYYRLRGWN